MVVVSRQFPRSLTSSLHHQTKSFIFIVLIEKIHTVRLNERTQINTIQHTKRARPGFGDFVSDSPALPSCIVRYISVLQSSSAPAKPAVLSHSPNTQINSRINTFASLKIQQKFIWHTARAKPSYSMKKSAAECIILCNPEVIVLKSYSLPAAVRSAAGVFFSIAT